MIKIYLKFLKQNFLTQIWFKILHLHVWQPDGEGVEKGTPQPSSRRSFDFPRRIFSGNVFDSSYLNGRQSGTWECIFWWNQSCMPPITDIFKSSKFILLSNSFIFLCITLCVIERHNKNYIKSYIITYARRMKHGES